MESLIFMIYKTNPVLDQCGKGYLGDCQVTECAYVALGFIRKVSSVLTSESSPTETVGVRIGLTHNRKRTLGLVTSRIFR